MARPIVGLLLTVLLVDVLAVDKQNLASSTRRLARKMSSHASLEVQMQAAIEAHLKEQAKWEGGEHTDLANRAWDYCATHNAACQPAIAAPQIPIPMFPNVVLSFGQIVALAGDFYAHLTLNWNANFATCDGGPTSPVCQDPARAAVHALYRRNVDIVSGDAPEVQREVPMIQNIMSRETPFATPREGLGATQPLRGYNQINAGEHLNVDYSRVTRDSGDQSLSPRSDPGVTERLDALIVRPGRMMQLAYLNRDHFKVDGAEKVYKIFHHMAIQHVINNRGTDTFYGSAFKEAIVMEGFALHYLTDLFSAGHLRTPRGWLRDKCQPFLSLDQSLLPPDMQIPGGLTGEITGGGLANCMHGEDNMLGLNVRARGDASVTWRAFGDKNWADPRNRVNRDKAIEAAALSIAEVFAAYRSGSNTAPDNFAALPKLPEVLPNNFPPLYAPGLLGVLTRRMTPPEIPSGAYGLVVSCLNQAAPLSFHGGCAEANENTMNRILRSNGAEPRVP